MRILGTGRPQKIRIRILNTAVHVQCIQYTYVDNVYRFLFIWKCLLIQITNTKSGWTISWGEGGASHVYHLLSGSSCRTILSFSRCQLCFFSRRLKWIMLFRSNIRSLKNINVYHILVAESSLYNVHTTCHLWTEFYKLEKTKSVFPFLNPVRCYVLQLQNLETPAACKSRLVLNSPDFLYEVADFCWVFSSVADPLHFGVDPDPRTHTSN